MDEKINENNPLLENAEMQRFGLMMDREKERKRRLSFIFGVVVVIFSLIGFFGCVVSGVNFFRGRAEEKKQQNFKSYNEFLIAVAAVAPAPFDDITGASMEELIEIAIWSIIGKDLEPDMYDYSSGELAIPVADVEAAYTRYFGTDMPVSHRSVTGYGYEFSYNPDDGCYYIPLTTIEPFYTPDVTEAEVKGDTVVLTVGLINANAWKQNSSTGAVLQPDPDRFIKVTLRSSGGSFYIGAVRSVNMTETAIVEVFTTQVVEADVTEEEAQETSTEETAAQE